MKPSGQTCDPISSIFLPHSCTTLQCCSVFTMYVYKANILQQNIYNYSVETIFSVKNKHTLYFNDSLILAFKQTSPNFCISPDKILFSDIEFYRITSKKARRTFKNGLGVPFTTLRIKSKPTVYSVVVFSK